MGNRIIAGLVIVLAAAAFVLAPTDARVMACLFMWCMVFGELRQFKGAGNG